MPRRLVDLPRSASPTAWVQFDLDGRLVTWTHQQLLWRSARVANLFRQSVEDAERSGAAIVIDGAASGSWLVTALAAMIAGRPIVAFPETVADPDTIESLPPLPVDLVVTDDPARWPGMQSIGLAQMTTLQPDVPGGSDDGGRATELHFDVVAYTSGTTATRKVKCFRLWPDSTEVFATEFTRRFGLGPGDTWAVCHSFSHIVHFEYVLASLLYGINVRITTAADVVRGLGAIAPSAVVTVPAVYEQMARLMENRVRASGIQRWVHGGAGLLPDSALTREVVRRGLQLLLPAARGASGGKLKVMIIGAAASTPTLKRRLSALGLPLYEGYGMTEVGMIACQTVGGVRLGTVGRPWPGLDAWVDDNGVLCVRPLVRRTLGYLGLSEDEAPLMNDDGVIKTGDLATLDPNGHLRILGREKAVIVSDRGKNVNPTVVEARLGQLKHVLAAVAYGDGRPYLSAVVFLGPAAPDVTPQELAELNRRSPEHERVHALVQTRHVPSLEDGLLTRSGKLRPSAVLERFEAQLTEVYRR